MEGSLWERCLVELETTVPQQQFNTWVRPLQAVEEDGGLRLLAPNRFVIDWVQQHLLGRIREILDREADGMSGFAVRLEVGSRSAAVAPPAIAAGRPKRAAPAVLGARINPDFTFETFVFNGFWEK